MSRFVRALAESAGANAGSEARGLVVGEPHAPRRSTWSQVRTDALRMAAGLPGGGAVAILASEPGLVARAVQAVWATGASATMLHQPTPRTDLNQWVRDTLRVLAMIDARVVLLGPSFRQVSGALTEHGIAHLDLAALADRGGRMAEQVDVPEESIALLQLTSGSTADPKAVRISHANLDANVRAMAEAADLRAARDVAVSWLPLFHDMGMVGCLTVPMTIGMEVVQITPADFLAAPLLWPELISRYGGTITAAPNFGYAVTARRMARADAAAFDLSRLRLALNGAEPIDPDAARSFTAEGVRFGLRPEAMVCAFGMAEATLAVSIAPLDQGLRVDAVDPGSLERRRRAEPADGNARRFALLGRPLPGLEVEVTDESGRALAERDVGQLRVRGTTVTPGYVTVDGPVAALEAAGWLDTGDDGYLVDGQIVICGRRKDVIIMGGRNIYPVDVERAACAVDGVRAGNAAAVRRGAGERRERFAVLVESRSAGDERTCERLRKEIAARVVDAVGARPYRVVVLEPGSLPKTPSGKLKRAATAELLD